MDNTNTQTQSNSLAGNITTKSADPFAEDAVTSSETKLLVDKFEERQTGVIKKASTPTVIKKETFLERLLSNAGIKPTDQKKDKTVSSTSTVKPKADFKKFTRAFLIILILLVICSGAYLFLFLTNIDTQIVKITLNGTVTNSADTKPIEGAEIFVDNTSVAKTDSSGKYSIKVDKLKFTLKATLKDFTDYEENISIPRTILSYSFTKNISLTSSKLSQVTGKFLADSPTYKFSNDKLFFNDEEFVLNDDGTFNLTEVPTGKVKLTFESASFIDISQDLTLNPGNNTIKEIKLTSAGDAVGSVISFIREDMVLKTKFSIENVQDNQISISDQGKFRIKDLDIARTYKIRSSADGYQTRDYEITIKQGENEVFGFKMVEEGTATYIGSDALKKDHFFASDLDGTNPLQLETIKDFAPKNEYYDSRDGLLYFLSAHEKLKNIYKTLDVAYSLNPVSLELKRLTISNLDTLNNLTTNFRAKRIVNNYQIKNDTQKRRLLQIMDITGDNFKTLRTVTGNNNYDNIVISGNGQYVYFREGDLAKTPVELPIVYRADSQSDSVVKVTQRKDVQIHAVSEDGNLVVYSALNETTNLRDLLLFNAVSNETRTIKENHDGSQYQFLNQNNDQLIFFAKRDSKIDIFSYSISQNSTTRITNLAADDEIKNLYQQDKYAFYLTKRGLFVIDILKPHSFKLVTDKVTKYTN